MLLLLSHRRDPFEAGGRDEQRRLRVAHAERPEQLEVLGELETEVAAGHDGVDTFDGNQVVGREVRRCVSGKRAPEGLDRVGVELHPGGHAMAAEAS